jgi:hypothetical protein
MILNTASLNGLDNPEWKKQYGTDKFEYHLKCKSDYPEGKED